QLPAQIFAPSATTRSQCAPLLIFKPLNTTLSQERLADFTLLHQSICAGGTRQDPVTTNAKSVCRFKRIGDNWFQMASAERTSVREKVVLFEKALELFLDRVRADSNLLAAVLVGSLTEETVWRRDSISLWLIEKDGVTKRLRADGEDPRVFRTLVEEGINIHVELIPRSRFKRMVEGPARTAFRFSFFLRRKFVFCTDTSLAKWLEEAGTVARRDQERELCIATTWLIHVHRYAARLIEPERDLELAHQELICGAHCVAAAEVIASGEVHEGIV